MNGVTGRKLKGREDAHVEKQTHAFDVREILRYTIKVKEVVMSKQSYKSNLRDC